MICVLRTAIIVIFNYLFRLLLLLLGRQLPLCLYIILLYLSTMVRLCNLSFLFQFAVLSFTLCHHVVSSTDSIWFYFRI